MSGVISALAGAAGSTATVLDTQTVTSGAAGTAPMLDRTRGFIGGGIGSISDGSSNIYSGANIPAFYWDEFGGAPQYVLTITGASNSGWTQVVLNGTTTLLRASASFASSTWTWSGAPPLGSQAFGSSGSTVNAVFT